MKKEEWFVLLNPFAARGKTKRKELFIKEQLTQAGIKFQFAVSNSLDEAHQIIHEAIENGFRKFISVGGDGAFNCLVNGIFTQQKDLPRHVGVSPSEITIAIIPIGTGNDWIKTHGIPKSISKSIEIIKNGRTDFHDVGIVRKQNNDGEEKRFFINVAGFAFQGFVAERIEGTGHWLKIGFAAFYLGLLDALFRYRTTTLKISFDDKQYEGKFFNISAGICKYAGGGMKLTPDAITNDGLLDITIAGNLSKPEVIRNVFRLFNGSYVHHKKIIQARTKKISIESSHPFPIETDGEVFGYGNAEVEILEKAIRVIIP